jgi:hypothetical protein
VDGYGFLNYEYEKIRNLCVILGKCIRSQPRRRLMATKMSRETTTPCTSYRACKLCADKSRYDFTAVVYFATYHQPWFDTVNAPQLVMRREEELGNNIKMLETGQAHH